MGSRPFPYRTRLYLYRVEAQALRPLIYEASRPLYEFNEAPHHPSDATGQVASVHSHVDPIASRRKFYKVPVDQRRVNPEAYKPGLFFYGPYQHAASSADAAASKEGHHFKQQAAKAVLLEEDGLQVLATKIEGHDLQIRALYAQMPSFEVVHGKDLAAAMALDGATIIAEAVCNPDSALSAHPIRRMLLRDALLLENQVPKFVLMYASENLETGKSLEDVLHWYCKSINPFRPEVLRSRPDPKMERSECLLGAVYDSLTPFEINDLSSGRREITNTFEDPSLPNASYLARCGVRFQSCSANFSGINFDAKAKVLKLPVGEDTVTLLHNLLAYEASCRYPHEHFVTSYCYFMDRLINSTQEDAQLLVEAGVIRNILGSSQELATSWTKLCSFVSYHITQKDRNIMLELEALSKIRWRRCWAEFKDKYWEKHPWLLCSIGASIIMLVLGFVQMIYAIKSAQ